MIEIYIMAEPKETTKLKRSLSLSMLIFYGVFALWISLESLSVVNWI